MLPPLLLQVLTHPGQADALTLGQWDLLVRQARRANLLATLALRLQGRVNAPAPVLPHLLSAQLLAERQRVAVNWEVQCIQQALAATGVPVVLMKGTAYLMAGLPAADGRLFGDVDIIVPQARLADVETALLRHGWESSDTSAYDQRYYREWMHEIPPMHHRRRGSVIDLHHAILPRTARIRADSATMMAAAVPVPDHPGLLTFAPTDMVLHSATHLFHEGEFDNGLRDLFDLDALLRHFGRDAAFWDELPARAQRLGLMRPLHHALRYATSMLNTPAPPKVLAEVGTGGPGPLTQWWLDACFRRALRPLHGSCDDGFSRLARGLLYVRSHWLRMPLPLLLVHLTRKALVREAEPGTDDQDDPMALRPPSPGTQAVNRHSAQPAMRRRCLLLSWFTAAAGAMPSAAMAAEVLPDLIQRMRPSVQTVGFYKETNNPRFSFRGTAFAVGNGNLLVTNAHVVASSPDVSADSQLTVNVRDAAGNDQLRRASVLAQDNAHDLALLRVDGPALPVLTLREETDDPVREGQAVAFMGYPLGAALGFAPVTHRGMVSAIRPVAIPSPTATQLDARTAARIRGGAFELYQLDATAYPGNSGGPLFDVSTGRVIGVVNMVTLKGTRESALSQPSGISYAIPVRHVLDLLAQNTAR